MIKKINISTGRDKVKKGCPACPEKITATRKIIINHKDKFEYEFK